MAELLQTPIKDKSRFDFVVRFGMMAALYVLWASLTFSSALVEISFVFALVFWALWRMQNPLQIPKTLWIPLAGFVILSLGSYLWSEYPNRSFRGVFKVLQQVMIFWMAADVFRSRKDLSRFETFFLMVFSMVVLNSFFQYWLGHDLIRGFEGEKATAGIRITGSFHTYGQLGAFLIMTLPMMAMMLWVQWKQSIQRKKVVLCALAFLGGLIILFLTRSRGAFVAFALGVIFFLIIKRRFILLLILGVALVGSLFVLPRGMVIHLDKHGREQSLVERYYLWDRALYVIKAKPVTGTGINTYAIAHQKYDQTQNWRVRDYYAHNGYLQMAAETGLPALFLFLCFLFQYFRLSAKRSRLRQTLYGRVFPLGLLIGVFNFLALVLVDTVLHNPQSAMAFWYLLGLQWSYQEVLDRPDQCP